MAKIAFTEDLAFSVANFSSFEKGKVYFDDGLVSALRKDGEEFTATVTGNEPYRVRLRFDHDELTYSCSCPYDFGGACKHVVAAILAFASDRNVAHPKSGASHNESEIKRLLLESSSGDLQDFLLKLLKRKPELAEDLKIFLAGPQETPVRISEYTSRFMKVLNGLDMRQLLEMWYVEGEDYYDTDGYGNYYEGASLGDIVSNFIDEGRQYEENGNAAEAMKIYQAVYEALDEKQGSLKGEYIDLADAFIASKEESIDRYVSILVQTDNTALRGVGLRFFGSVFLNDTMFQEQIFKSIKTIHLNGDDAGMMIDLLTKSDHKDMSSANSGLLAYLYHQTGNMREFEAVSIRALHENPELAPDLLAYFQKVGRRDDVIRYARDVLSQLASRDEIDYSLLERDVQNLEITIREFMKTVYSPTNEYLSFINNLERIHLLTGSLKDYQELVKFYRSAQEKEQYWQRMETHSVKEHDILHAFKVYKYEDQKDRILKLVRTHHDADCFPDMVNAIEKHYPAECFAEYKKKIDAMLVETDTQKYQEAAHHLKIMQGIGMDKEFFAYVNDIKTNYRRRRRLLEELKEKGL
ncbi:MAG: SWIM zinc finger family protein [Patescibacteria group bacterium]